MSDFSVRSRRRVHEEGYSSRAYEDHDLKKTQAVSSQPPAAAAQNFSFNTFNTVFSASPAQLWNSAQEAFSSIPPPATYFQPTTEAEQPAPESEFPKLAIFGDRIDFLVVNMPTRDRTNEFRTTAKSFQMKIQANGHHHHDKKEVIVESVQFNQLAKRIGRDLSQTCAKMEKLAEMTKKKSLLDERSEMDRLSKVVTEDITALNKQIATLNEFSRRRKGGRSHQGYVHSENVVLGLQSKLATVGQDFKTVLEIGTENLKAQKSRREKFSHSNAVPMSLPSSSGNPNSRSRLLLDEEYEKSNGSVALDMGAMEQFTSQQQVFRDQTGEYVAARSNAMETIEGSIHELGQIFSQLASLVSEQGEVITRIDSNVDDAAINIDAAHTELVRYFANISRNRWLIIKVLGTLMVFFIIFVVFLT